MVPIFVCGWHCVGNVLLNFPYPTMATTQKITESCKAIGPTNGGAPKLRSILKSTDLRDDSKDTSLMDFKHLPHIVTGSLTQVPTPVCEVKEVKHVQIDPNFSHTPAAIVQVVSGDGNESVGAKTENSQIRCYSCGELGHKANHCHRSQRSHAPHTRWQKNTLLVSQSKQHCLEEALGAADAKIESLRDKIAQPPPSIQVSSDVKSVDFDITLPCHAFTVYSQPLGLLASMLADLDGNHIEDQQGNNVQQAHMWKFVSKLPMDVKLDQRPVQYLGFETYKRDANLQVWDVERNRRFASFATMWKTGRTMSVHTVRCTVSMTMVMNMISRDGVRLICSADNEFLRARYDIIATSVNIPQLAGLKENTLDFVRDYAQYISNENHMFKHDDLPYFHTRLLDETDTELPTGIDDGKSSPWVASNPFDVMSGLGTNIVFITSIFLVYLLGLMLKGPFYLARTLMINVRYREASPSELVVRFLALIALSFVGFVVLFVGGYIVIFARFLLTLTLVSINGLLTLAILTGELTKYSGNLLKPVAYFAQYTLSVRASLSVSHIIVGVVVTRKLVPLILDQMHLRPLVVRYLLQLRQRSIILAHLSSMFQWLIGLDM